MRHPFETKLAEAWPPADWADVTVLLAVSGGPDSVAMLRAMAALKTTGPGRLCVAHLNHGLRDDAEADERFVVDLCGQLGVTCEVERLAVGGLADGDGIEAAARKARYRFFEQTAGRIGARYVATAHTADDQAETILHRIVRGTGVRGLSGMSRTRRLAHATLIRPMLAIRRADVMSYLEAIGQTYRHDSSNADTRFTRNRIRHELLPLLVRRFNPDVVDALLRLGRLAGEAQQDVDHRVAEWLDRCVKVVGPGDAELCLAELHEATQSVSSPRHSGHHHKDHRPETPYFVRELLTALWQRMGWPLQAMGMAQWDELAVMALGHAGTAKRVFPGGVVVEVAGERMRFYGAGLRT